MKRSGFLEHLLLTTCFMAPGNLLAQVRHPNDQQILSQARRSYYNLRNEGVTSFSCRVMPDWDSVYKGFKIDGAGESLRSVLAGMHFEVTVDPDGAVHFSDHSDMLPVDEQVTDRLRTVTSGMENVVTGFFKIWLSFMFASVISENDNDYQLEDVGEEYRLTQREGAARVSVTMSKDFAVTEMAVDTSEMELKFYPQFSLNSRRYLLTSYDTQMKVTTSAQSVDVRTSGKIEYQEIQRVKLPSNLKTIVATAANTVEIQISFKDCEVKSTKSPGLMNGNY